MIAHLAPYISVVFLLTSLATLLAFAWILKASSQAASNKTWPWIIIGILFWLGLQTFLSLTGVYKNNTQALPPKIIIWGILPVILLFIILFSSVKGKQFLATLSILHLTCLHVVRIPVELVLYWLFLSKAIPQLMTFDGLNFDILAGITAPFIAYFGIYKKKIGNLGLLIWNFISLGLLVNIIILALLSAPSPIQVLAFDQANIAVLHFPFVFLPTFIVPIVLLSHLIVIRNIIKTKG